MELLSIQKAKSGLEVPGRFPVPEIIQGMVSRESQI